MHTRTQPFPHPFVLYYFGDVPPLFGTEIRRYLQQDRGTILILGLLGLDVSGLEDRGDETF